MTIKDLQENLRKFVAERNWNEFHSPKSMLLSLTSEVGEVCDLFRWLTPEQEATVMDDPRRAEAVREEIADVYTNLLLLAEGLNIDLVEEAKKKLKKTSLKYPASQWNGKNTAFFGHIKKEAT